MAEKTPKPKAIPLPKVDPQAIKIVTLTPKQNAASQMVNLSKNGEQ